MKALNYFKCWFCRYNIFDEIENKKRRLCNKCYPKYSHNKEQSKERYKLEYLKAKKELRDSYIIRLISIRDKLKYNQISKEMIEITRQSLKIKKYIKDTFNCKIHGILTRIDLIRNGYKKDGTPYFKCKYCRKIIRDKNYQLYKDNKIEKNNDIRSNQDGISECL